MTKKSKRLNTPEFNFVPEDLVCYRAIDCANDLCSANDILDRIRYDSLLMFKNIKNGVLNLNSVYIKDDICKSDLGLGKRPYVNSFCCLGCKMLRSLCYNLKLPSNNLITIQVGKYEGRTLSVEKYDENFENHKNDLELDLIFKKFIRHENELNLIDDGIANIHRRTTVLSTSSGITNYAIISIIINNKMQKYKLNNCILLDWVYSCDGKIKFIKTPSYSFKELSGLESLSKHIKTATAQSKITPLNEKIVSAILKQLIVVLHFLSKYFFIHGRPCIDYLKFTNKPCNYKYGEVSVESPITLHLEPSYYTSITYEKDNNENVRFITNKHTDIQKMFSRYPVESIDLIVNYKPKTFLDNYEIPLLPDLKSHLVYCYKIGDRINDLIDLHTKYGTPLLHGSFEFYCFLISLLCEDNFYTTFIENDNLRTIWYSLWKLSEYEEVNNDLIKLKTKTDIYYEDIIQFVSKYYLRTDALKYFYECVSCI